MYSNQVFTSKQKTRNRKIYPIYANTRPHLYRSTYPPTGASHISHTQTQIKRKKKRESRLPFSRRPSAGRWRLSCLVGNVCSAGASSRSGALFHERPSTSARPCTSRGSPPSPLAFSLHDCFSAHTLTSQTASPSTRRCFLLGHRAPPSFGRVQPTPSSAAPL